VRANTGTGPSYSKKLLRARPKPNERAGRHRKEGMRGEGYISVNVKKAIDFGPAAVPIHKTGRTRGMRIRPKYLPAIFGEEYPDPRLRANRGKTRARPRVSQRKGNCLETCGFERVKREEKEEKEKEKAGGQSHGALIKLRLAMTQAR